MKEIYIPTTGPPGNKNGPHARGMRGKLEDGRRKLEARSWKLEAGLEGKKQMLVSGEHSVVKRTTRSHKETHVCNVRDPADVNIRDGTQYRCRNGTVVRIPVCRTGRRDGTFLPEKIPKQPAQKRTGVGKFCTNNNREAGMKWRDINAGFRDATDLSACAAPDNVKQKE